MENLENNWKLLGKAKKAMNDALDQTDLKDWEIKEVVLVKKGSETITNGCRIIRKPDGSMELVC